MTNDEHPRADQPQRALFAKEWLDIEDRFPLLPDAIACVLDAICFWDEHIRNKEDLSVDSHMVNALIQSLAADADDIMVLCTLGRKTSAVRLLRTVFEKAAVAEHLALNPSATQDFIDFDIIHQTRLLKEAQSEPHVATISEDYTAHLQIEYEKSIARFKPNKCPICKEREPRSWTPTTVETMVASTGLRQFSMTGYRIPTLLIHPSYFGLKAQLFQQISLELILLTLHGILVHSLLVHHASLVDPVNRSPNVQQALDSYDAAWSTLDRRLVMEVS